MKQTACFVLLCLALGLSTAAAVTLGDLQGTWKGHCLQYSQTTDGASVCMPYKGNPNRNAYSVTYNGSAVSYIIGAAGTLPSDSGSVMALTKYKSYSCANVLFAAAGNTSYVVSVSTVNGVKTYVEEGVFALPSGAASAQCLLKGSAIGERLYCDAKKANYICTATLV